MPSTYIQVASGDVFDPLNPVASEVLLADIAHSLATSTRYNGHTTEPYSIAEHVVRASKLTEEWGFSTYVSLWTLHHDDPEVYTGDLCSPLKNDPDFGQRFRGCEARLMRVICEHFGLNPKQPRGVEEADRIMLKWEVRDLMPEPTPRAREIWKPWLNDLGPAPEETLKPWGWRKAKKQYLARHEQLTERLEKEGM